MYPYWKCLLSNIITIKIVILRCKQHIFKSDVFRFKKKNASPALPNHFCPDIIQALTYSCKQWVMISPLRWFFIKFGSHGRWKGMMPRWHLMRTSKHIDAGTCSRPWLQSNCSNSFRKLESFQESCICGGVKGEGQRTMSGAGLHLQPCFRQSVCAPG